MSRIEKSCEIRGSIALLFILLVYAWKLVRLGFK